MSRMGISSLVRSNLLRRPLRTGILAALVGVFAMALLCGTLLAQKAGEGTRGVMERLGADVLFVPYGYEGKAQSSLLRGEPSSFYMDRAFEDDLRKEPGVERVTSQLFLATLHASCCSLPVQLIGFDPKTDFVVKPWMSSKLDRPLREDEVVVGSKIASNPGDAISLFGKEFRVAAKLDETGMGFDTSVFLELDRARNLLLLSELGPRLGLPEGLDRSTFVSSVLVKVSPGTNVGDLVNALSEKYAVRYNLDFVVVAEMVTDIASKLLVFSGIFRIFSGVLWLLALTVLGLVFVSSVNERKREFGILRVIGATRRALLRMVLGEALAVSAAGALAGSALAAAVFLLFGTYMDVSMNLPAAGLSAGDVCLTALGTLLLGALTGPLACIPAARRIAKVDAYLSVREEQ